MAKRKSKTGVVLKKGEGEVPDRNLFFYRWTDKNSKRKIIYAKTLKELREKEKAIAIDRLEEINTDGMYKSVNDIYKIWCQLKRGLKANTFSNYKYMYETYVLHSKFGQKKIGKVKKSDIKSFYNNLKDDKNLKVSTIDGVHTVLRQVFQLAVDDGLIRNNPADNVLVEMKKERGNDSEKRIALTLAQEERFLDYMLKTPKYRHWYPIFFIMIRTGMRVGECTGLRWDDLDLDNNTIDINHTLVYYSKGKKDGCSYAINSPKTIAGKRMIPMSDEVKEAFLDELNYQREVGIESKAVVDGYRDFVFVNRFGQCMNNGILNKALARIIRDANDEALYEDDGGQILLPHFSCHNLRHSFATRMCEAGLNMKFIQDILGHADITTTMNIYADCTDRIKFEAMGKLEDYYHKGGNTYV